MTQLQKAARVEVAQQIRSVVMRLVRTANAKAVYLIDRAGQLIVAAAGDGEEEIDVTSLGSLTAGSIAAAGGVAQVLKEQEFTGQYHEGQGNNVHMRLVGRSVILVVIFDSNSSIGLVRLRARESCELLGPLFETLHQSEAQDSGFSDGDLEDLLED